MPAADDHVWVGATHVPLDEKQARWANNRGSVKIREELKVDVLEIYCNLCRRPFDDVVGEPCVAVENNEHLRGGPIGERRKRKHPYHDCIQYDCTLPLPAGMTRTGR